MKQKIINENNNGWNGNNQNPWGQNNNRQNFENPFDGLQNIEGVISVTTVLTNEPTKRETNDKTEDKKQKIRGPSGSGFSNPSRSLRDVPEESLMLTGDENIVDIDFSVFWVIKDASSFLFKIQYPERTIKAVSESAMREVVGNSDIQPILTGARQKTENNVRALMQSTLDSYGSGIEIREVKMQKVDPPSAVIDAFRDVQAARADQERARNEANAYANKIVPEAQGEASKILMESEAYQSQTVAEAEGQATRFVSIYSEYIQAKDVTRQRMFLETMEKVFGSMNKIIVDNESVGGQGVVPYLPLNEINKKGQR